MPDGDPLLQHPGGELGVRHAGLEKYEIRRGGGMTNLELIEQAKPLLTLLGDTLRDSLYIARIGEARRRRGYAQAVEEVRIGQSLCTQRLGNRLGHKPEPQVETGKTVNLGEGAKYDDVVAAPNEIGQGAFREVVGELEIGLIDDNERSARDRPHRMLELERIGHDAGRIVWIDEIHGPRALVHPALDRG